MTKTQRMEVLIATAAVLLFTPLILWLFARTMVGSVSVGTAQAIAEVPCAGALLADLQVRGEVAYEHTENYRLHEVIVGGTTTLESLKRFCAARGFRFVPHTGRRADFSLHVQESPAGRFATRFSPDDCHAFGDVEGGYDVFIAYRYKDDRFFAVITLEH